MLGLLPHWLSCKNPPYDAGDTGSIPGPVRSPGGKWQHSGSLRKSQGKGLAGCVHGFPVGKESDEQAVHTVSTVGTVMQMEANIMIVSNSLDEGYVKRKKYQAIQLFQVYANPCISISN